MFYSMNISIGGVVVPRLAPYIHHERKAESLERVIDATLFVTRTVNKEGQSITKYHFEIPGIDNDKMIDIQKATLKTTLLYLIDYYEIPELLSGDNQTRNWTLRRALASESYLPKITVDGEAQGITLGDIDVGSPAIDRTIDYPGEMRTFIVKERPCPFTGKITYIEIFAYQALTYATVATFTQVAENVFTARASEFIGDVSDKESFEVNLDVVKGDFIGFYFKAGSVERDLEGEGFWIETGDQTSCSEKTFDFKPGQSISLYASQIVPAGKVNVNPETGAMAFGTIPSKTPDNIIIEYVPKYKIHIVSWTPANRYGPGLITYNLICEEI